MDVQEINKPSNWATSYCVSFCLSTCAYGNGRRRPPGFHGATRCLPSTLSLPSPSFLPLSRATCRCLCSFTLLNVAHQSRSFAVCYASRLFYTQPVTSETQVIHPIRYFRPSAELLGKPRKTEERRNHRRLSTYTSTVIGSGHNRPRIIR